MGSQDNSLKLRWPLEIHRVQDGTEHFFVFSDPVKLTSELVYVPIKYLPLLERLSYGVSHPELQTFASTGAVTLDELEDLLGMLNGHLLLDNESSRRALRQVREEFLALASRPTVFANRIYPAKLDAATAQLSQMKSEALEVRTQSFGPHSIGLFIAPHIDYQRGWQCYGSALKYLEATETPDVVILLGTSHQYSETMFHLWQNDMDSPFGAFQSAREVNKRLLECLGVSVLGDGFLHRDEHALELQLPLLGYRFEERLPEVMPLLVGSLHQSVGSNTKPEGNHPMNELADALAELIEELHSKNQRVLLHCGVDLAHVGIHFGDQERFAVQEQLQLIEARDKELINLISNLDANGLFQHIAEDQDARRVCGFPSMYLALSVLNRLGAKADSADAVYQQSVTVENDCVVSFMSGYVAAE